MRWVKFDTSANGIFSREVCPEDSEYLHSHIDTFKCMWHEQTRNYWVRMVVSLREYVRKHIFTQESLERLGAPREIFELVIDCAYVNICSSFTQESYGKAKEFLLATINVTATRDMIGNIGARPLSNDPFFNKFTRDFYRTVFGPPSPSTLKNQLQAYLTAPLFGRFAAGVVAVLKEWVQTADCSLKEVVVKFHKQPYWSYPSDFCPQKTLFKYLDENCVVWETPDWEEVEQVMLKAPDRETEFADVVACLPKDFRVHEDLHLGYDSSSDASEEGDSPHGIKDWTNIMYAVCEKLKLSGPCHFEELCVDCMAASDDEWSYLSDDSSILSDDESYPREIDDVHSDYDFWRQPRVVALLIAAEKKFNEVIASKGIGVHININIGSGGTATAANPPRKARRQPRKMPPRTVANAGVVANGSAATSKPNVTNGTSTASKPNIAKQQFAFAKSGAVLSATQRPTIINLEDNEEKNAKVAAALERLKLKIGTPPGPQQQERPQELAKKPRKTEDQKTSTKSTKVKKKSSANGSAVAPKVQERKCAKCRKSDGCKLKKCSLCVQKKMEPVYYCSRECQMEDWDEHQVVHFDDLD